MYVKTILCSCGGGNWQLDVTNLFYICTKCGQQLSTEPDAGENIDQKQRIYRFFIYDDIDLDFSELNKTIFYDKRYDTKIVNAYLEYCHDCPFYHTQTSTSYDNKTKHTEISCLKFDRDFSSLKYSWRIPCVIETQKRVKNPDSNVLNWIITHFNWRDARNYGSKTPSCHYNFRHSFNYSNEKSPQDYFSTVTLSIDISPVSKDRIHSYQFDCQVSGIFSVQSFHLFITVPGEIFSPLDANIDKTNELQQNLSRIFDQFHIVEKSEVKTKEIWNTFIRFVYNQFNHIRFLPDSFFY